MHNSSCANDHNIYMHMLCNKSLYIDVVLVQIQVYFFPIWRMRGILSEHGLVRFQSLYGTVDVEAFINPAYLRQWYTIEFSLSTVIL